MTIRFVILLASAAIALHVCARSGLKLTRERTVFTHHGRSGDEAVERNDFTIRPTRLR